MCDDSVFLQRSTQPEGNRVAMDQIARLQRDGLLLLAHLAETADRQVTPADPGAEAAIDAGLLTAPPAAIAQDPASMNRLIGSVDRLGRAALPATISSIRLTSAYLYGATAQVSEAEAHRARNLRRWMDGLRWLLLVAVGLAVGLLMHADDGRRIVGQLATVRGDLDRAYADLAKLDRGTDFVPQLFFPVAGQPAPPMPALTAIEACWPVDDQPATPDPPATAARQTTTNTPPPRQPAYYLVPAKPNAQTLCSLLYQYKLREAMIYGRLAEWNCRTTLMNPLNLVHAPFLSICETPPVPLGVPATAKDWARTELRTNDGVIRLTGYILPLLLGGIGGCVFVLRRIDEKLKTWTLAAHDGVAAGGRVILAATFGGLLGLVLGTDGGAVQLGGFSLSLAAWAFFLGYSLETVLKALDALIGGVLAKLKAPGEERRTVPLAEAGARGGTGGAPVP